MATLTTPGLGLPYPDGAERVMDGDNAIGALATAVDGPLTKLWRPPGVIVSGPARTMTASPEKLPLSTLVQGTAGMFSDATDELLVTTGNGGLYIAWLYGFLTLPTAGGYLRAALRTGGATVQTGVGIPTWSGLTSYFALSVVLQLADANAVSVWMECAAGNFPTVTVQRFGIARMGSAFGTLLAELEAGTQPADA